LGGRVVEHDQRTNGSMLGCCQAAVEQFLVEATLISSIGGIAGILVAMLLGVAINVAVPGFEVSYSTFSIGAAFLTSTGIGVAFGFFPARRAAFLDPVVALSRD